MKINEIFDDPAKNKNVLLEAAENELEDAMDELSTLEQAYEELALLRKVFEKQDFGYLIGKENQQLTEKDIERIKRELRIMLKGNDLIVDGNLLWERISHGFEVVSLSALTGALAYTALFLTGPIGAIFAGTIAVGTFALGYNQLKMVKSIETAIKVINMTKEYEKIAGRPKVSAWKRFLGRFKRKSPQELEIEGRKSISRTSKMIERDFKRLVKDLPETIPYTDYHGEIKQYPVKEFFNVQSF